MNIDAMADFVIVLILFLAAIGVATLVVAVWTLLVARWEDRRRVAEFQAAHEAAKAAQETYPLPQQRTEAGGFRSVDGSGNVRIVGGRQQ